ncbi:MAG: SDR family oxidoreductase [Bacteroidota bacterium]
MVKERISIMGCGWLGFPLAIELIRLGYTINGSTTRKEKIKTLEEQGISAFCIQATEQLVGEQINEFFQSEILILNIPPGRKRSDIETYHPIQIKNLVERAMANGVKKLLFISSTGVYGNVNSTVSESDLPNPSRPSGRALLSIENWLGGLENLEVSVLRMAGLVGGDRKAGRFLAGKKDLANGDAAVNMIHQEDAIGIILQLLRQGKWGITLNCCADEHPSRSAFYTAQAKKQGFVAPTFLENGPTTFKIVSNHKLKSILNYTFQHPDPMDF